MSLNLFRVNFFYENRIDPPLNEASFKINFDVDCIFPMIPRHFERFLFPCPQLAMAPIDKSLLAIPQTLCIY